MLRRDPESRRPERRTCWEPHAIPGLVNIQKAIEAMAQSISSGFTQLENGDFP